MVDTVFTHLKNNDLTWAYDYWKDPYKTPPLYSLTSYDIKQKIFDIKDGLNHAQLYVVLEFAANSELPSRREWIIELSDTDIGWKIIDFRLAE